MKSPDIRAEGLDSDGWAFFEALGEISVRTVYSNTPVAIVLLPSILG